jgi:hypothetical protein
MKKTVLSVGIAMLLVVIAAGVAYAATGTTDPQVLRAWQKFGKPLRNITM